MNFNKLKDFLDYYLPMLGVPGSDTVVFKDHEEIFRYKSGFDNLRTRTPVRKDAIYNLYSCTKIATCVAALQLIERGEMLVTDPVHIYFPEYKNLTVSNGTASPAKANSPMLIKHLFSMTSGLDYNTNRASISHVKIASAGKCPTLDIVRALPQDPLLFNPGECYNYGLSHDVLGGLVELISGMRLSEYMKKNIFDPLGMKDTGFYIEEKNLGRLASQYTYDSVGRCAIEIPALNNDFRFGSEYESGGAGLYSTVDDFILLMDALANGGVGKNGNRILSSRSIDLMCSPLLTAEQLKQFAVLHNTGYEYGYGVRVMRDPAAAGSLVHKGTFGWDGMRMCVAASDPEERIAIFHAEHIDSMNSIVLPRLMNVIYSCIDED